MNFKEEIPNPKKQEPALSGFGLSLLRSSVRLSALEGQQAPVHEVFAY